MRTKTGGASSASSSFQNFTFRKKISALPLGTSPRSAPTRTKLPIESAPDHNVLAKFTHPDRPGTGRDPDLTVAEDDVVAALRQDEELRDHPSPPPLPATTLLVGAACPAAVT